jgi:hypothetical protein
MPDSLPVVVSYSQDPGQEGGYAFQVDIRMDYDDVNIYDFVRVLLDAARIALDGAQDFREGK